MIQRLTIQNFQNHNSEFKLSPGINVIVGPSNVGKTVVVRALEWLRTNRPLGTAFLRHGMGKDDECKVEISYVRPGRKTPVKLGRRRVVKGKINEYYIGSDSMKAIGSDVPQVITDCLNFSDLNVQTQLMPHFLVLDSPGAVAKAINAAAHLEDMDVCVAEGNRRVRFYRSAIEQGEEEVEQLGKELIGFKDLGSLSEAVADAQECHKRVQKLKAQFDDLNMATMELLGAERRIAQAPDAALLQAAIEQADIVEELQRESRELRTEIAQHESTTANLKEVNGRVKACRQALKEFMADAICPTCGRAFDDEAKQYVMEMK